MSSIESIMRQPLHRHPVFRAVVLTLGGLLLAHSAHAQVTLNLVVIPTVVSFPDANPTTTPVIAATDPVGIRITVTSLSVDGSATTPWSVSALAAGDLLSGPDAIAISNVTWTAFQTDTFKCLGGCTCQAGTASDLVPQPMIVGLGSAELLCSFPFSLANDWSYNPGSYSQTMTITASSP